MKIIEEYRQGASVKSLMERCGFATKKSITDKIKKHFPDQYKNIIEEARNNRKQYIIDLSIIDSDFKAYFVGLLLTDGYIIDHNSFGLQMTDEDVIQFIANSTNNNYHMYLKQNEKALPEYRVVFYDAQQVTNLARYGIIPQKSYIIPAPQLYKEEEKFLPYLFRGIIDGDGCIYKTTHDTVAFYICTMSYDFAKWMKEILEERFFMREIRLTQTKIGLWKVESALTTNIIKLIGLIYDKPFGMSRKYNRLREMFRDYNNDNRHSFILDVG